MQLTVVVSVEEANLILNAIENAPLPLVKSAPLLNRLREEFIKQAEPKKPEVVSDSPQA